MQSIATNGNGEQIDPRSCVVPIMKELEKGKLSIIGTGFYITRYGLFLTAEHVLSDLMDSKRNSVKTSFICHQGENETVHLRRIRAINLFGGADIGVGQADNYTEKYPNNPLMNMRARLSSKILRENDPLVTYAYPENKILDFTQQEYSPVVRSDYYEGVCLKYVTDSEHPFIPYPHFETNIKIKSGASGGPVFYKGKVIGINCRGWDFGDNEDDLSYVVPMSLGLVMKVGGMQIPEISWENQQIPESVRDTKLTINDLIRFGHVQV